MLPQWREQQTQACGPKVRDATCPCGLLLLTVAPAAPCRHRTTLTVSSLHIEWIWVPNMTAVNVKNRRPSRHRKTNRITVMGGEKSLHSANEKEVLSVQLSTGALHVS